MWVGRRRYYKDKTQASGWERGALSEIQREALSFTREGRLCATPV